MINERTITYSLVLPGFHIEFDVKMQASIEWTRKFDSHGSDFVFAVADIWLRIGNSRHLLVSELHTGNLIEVLKSLEESFRKPISIENLGKAILRGGWGIWMCGYWSRLNDDSSATEDEAIYGQLSPLSIMEGQEGHIAIYRYDGMPTIEAATRSRGGDAPIYVWAEFDPEDMAGKTLKLRQSIAAKILENEPSKPSGTVPN